MATLAEIKKIFDDSSRDPGDPPNQEIVDATALRGRIEAALWKQAEEFLSGREVPTDGQERTEAIGWAQQVLTSSNAMAATALKLLLAANAGRTTDQILGVSDAAMETALGALVPRLAKGAFPGRR